MSPLHCPEQEAKRLVALKSYHVLNTPAEPELDDITSLAAELLAMPICIISLVDEHRLWFKSRAGISVTEVLRDQSFCDYAIRSRSLLVVTDALQDARFCDSALVVGEPNIRFYAGVPLITPEGALRVWPSST